MNAPTEASLLLLPQFCFFHNLCHFNLWSPQVGDIMHNYQLSVCLFAPTMCPAREERMKEFFFFFNYYTTYSVLDTNETCQNPDVLIINILQENLHPSFQSLSVRTSCDRPGKSTRGFS